LYDSEESSGKAGFVAGAGAGFHWMRLKCEENRQQQKKNIHKAVKEVDDHRLRRAPARLPSASSLAGRLLLLPASEFLGVLVLEKGSLDWLGAPTVLIYGAGKEIVARDRGAYPEKFGRWRDFLNRIVVGLFGIQAESYSVDGLS
jgi:hypothetical protein